MTSSTPRIPRHRPLLRSDLADQGTTLAANDAIHRDEEAASFAAHMRRLRPVLIVSGMCLLAVAGGAAVAFFN